MRTLLLVALSLISANSAWATRLEVNEWMRGYATPGVYTMEYGEIAENRKILQFGINIAVADIDAYVADANHEAPVTGWVRWGSRKKFPITGGGVKFFVPTGIDGLRTLDYRIEFEHPVEGKLTLSGRKYATDDDGLDIWKDTTTLFVDLLGGASNTPVARGIVHIKVPDLLVSVASIRTPGTLNPVASLAAKAKFGKLFWGELWNLYGPKR